MAERLYRAQIPLEKEQHQALAEIAESQGCAHPVRSTDLRRTPDHFRDHLVPGDVGAGPGSRLPQRYCGIAASFPHRGGHHDRRHPGRLIGWIPLALFVAWLAWTNRLPVKLENNEAWSEFHGASLEDVSRETMRG